MSDCLSKEQQLLLQQNLTYEVYEKFMNLFGKEDKELPIDVEEKKKFIFSKMKEHKYWGDISGWGENRVYYRLSSTNYSMDIIADTYLDWFKETFWMIVSRSKITVNELASILDKKGEEHKNLFGEYYRTKPGHCLSVSDSE